MTMSVFEVSQRIMSDQCVILDVSADQFVHPKTTVLKNQIERLLQQGYRQFVLNLTHVASVDSFGLAAFLSVLKLCRKQQGNLTLYGLNDSVKALMNLTRLDQVLNVYPTEEEALEQVQKPAH